MTIVNMRTAAATPALTNQNQHEDRGSGSIQRGRKKVEEKETGIKADMKPGELQRKSCISHFV